MQNKNSHNIIQNNNHKNIANKTYLSKRGYTIIKSYFTEQEIENVKKELTVKPNINTDFAIEEPPFPVYLENKHKLYVPKMYGINKFGQPNEVKLSDGNDITLNFNGSLKKDQEEPVNACIKCFNDDFVGGGLLSLPCGAGKTAIALYLISKMGKKAFILVHKEFLMNQWIERIEQFLPGAKIGKIQGNIIDIDNKDIVIGMIQSISMKDYDLDIFDTFGFAILDEAHRVPSREFSKALQKINSKYMLALSATPNRKDGLTKVLKWFIGDMIYQRKGKSLEQSVVRRYIMGFDDPEYNKEILIFNGKINSASMINNITSFYPRTLFILKLIKEFILQKRVILLLSDRKEHLKDIYAYSINNKLCPTGFYVGGMKESDLKNSADNCDLILATFQMAAEGLDIARIDTIILASPKTDIKQAIGRIRPKINVEFANFPLVIDIADNFSIFIGQTKKRNELYIKEKYIIETFKVDESGNIIGEPSIYKSKIEEEENNEEDDCKIKMVKKKIVKEKKIVEEKKVIEEKKFLFSN
jgi:superfamily II DNA or RNA helicase